MKLTYSKEVCKCETEEKTVEVNGWYQWTNCYYITFLNPHYIFKINHGFLGGFSVTGSKYAIEAMDKLKSISESEVRERVNPTIIDAIFPFIKSYFTLDEDPAFLAKESEKKVETYFREINNSCYA